MAARSHKISHPLSVGSTHDLVEVAYHRPPWLTGSYHPRWMRSQHTRQTARRDSYPPSPTVRTRPPAYPGRLNDLSVPHSKSVSHGAFVWARRALNGRKTAVSGPGSGGAGGRGAADRARASAARSTLRRTGADPHAPDSDLEITGLAQNFQVGPVV